MVMWKGALIYAPHKYRIETVSRGMISLNFVGEAVRTETAPPLLRETLPLPTRLAEVAESSRPVDQCCELGCTIF